MTVKDIKNMSFKEVLKLRKNLSDRSDYFNLSFAELSRLFLQNFTGTDLSKVSFGDLRRVFVDLFVKKDGVPEDEKGFYLFLAKTYLGIDKEPRATFVDIFTRVTSDLEEISNYLSFIDKELVRLNRLKVSVGRLSGAERYYKNQIEFYKERNLRARNEIVEFLSSDIKAFIVSRTHNVFFKNVFANVLPYKYSQMRMFSKLFNGYDVTALNDMSNKFMELPIQFQIECFKLHQERPADFFEFAKDYIQKQDPPGTMVSIRNAINDSHILSRRKRTIETILSHYANGDYLSFVNMAPLQIEGIFHDICLEVGIKQVDLDISSINDKLKKLEPFLGYSLQFEYYSFKFPVIRNAVAHGELIEDGVEQAAMMLMLDLGPVCELTLDSNIPLNASIDIVRAYQKDAKMESLVAWMPYIGISIPDFYRVDKTVEEMTRMYETTGFWEFLSQALDGEQDISSSPLLDFASKLRGKGIAVKQSKEFLASVSSRKKDVERRSAEMQAAIKQLFPELTKDTAPPADN